MNRSRNVFNAAPLGSGGASGFVFVKAALVCQAICNASLRVGRGLKSSITPTATLTGRLLAYRPLKALLEARASITARLAGYSAKYLSGVSDASAFTQAKLSKIHQRFLTSVLNAEARLEGTLRKVGKVNLVGRVDGVAQVTGQIRKVTQKFLQGAIPAQANTTGRLLKGIPLSGFISGLAELHGNLNESSRVHADEDRTLYIEWDDRTVVVPKGNEMGILKTVIKQPADILDYDFSFLKWLQVDDEIISAVTTIESIGTAPVGNAMVIDSTYVDKSFVKVWVSKGSSGEIYKVTCTVTTARGRVKQAEIKIKVREY